MKYQKTIGRVLYALPFVVFGIMHLVNADKMQGYVPSFIPGGIFWIYLTGLAFIAASISIISTKLIKLSGLLLALMLLIFVLTIHVPNLSNPQMMQMALGGLLKDVSLLGAALFISSTYDDKKEVKAS